MKIALFGYGKMGKTIEQIALQKGHTIVLKTSGKSSLEKIIEADVAIDFSTPKAAASNIKFCLERQIPIVCGTTGWLDYYDEIINFCNKCNGAFIYASNFSIGVNIFFKMNEYLAKLMKPWKEYQVTLEEIHHTEKLDTPSGTAITLAEDIIKNSDNKSWNLKKAKKKNIMITSKRVTNVKGTHTINYQSEIDTISIQHEAKSREGFALGALIAAEWLVGKKGVFSMKDVLKQK
ncbi:4-hydroxy-tetrahydrodipicolinate reductase [Flavobacteriaceae bacterium]|jgi:4-hydroxy-tetrahydrodipicolinate reductase|nr:4-hydroxy-tetrahydrodipicolinate reductase [Flavobacteriaceae bacterium]